MKFQGDVEGAPRAYRLGARAESMARTREAILRSSAEAFWSAPSSDITLETVAEGAGVTVQSILRHFGTKSALVAATVAWQTERVSTTRDPSAVTDASSAVDQLVAHYEEIGDGVLRLLSEERRMPELSAIVEQGRRFHQEWCRTVFSRTLLSLPPGERRVRLAQLVAVCDVYMWKLLRRDARLSRRATGAALLQILQPLVEGD